MATERSNPVHAGADARSLQLDFAASELGATVRCSGGGHIMSLAVVRANPAAATWTASIAFVPAAGGAPLLLDEETFEATGPDPLDAGFRRIGAMLELAGDGRYDDSVARFARALLDAGWPDVSQGRTNVIPLHPVTREA